MAKTAIINKVMIFLLLDNNSFIASIFYVPGDGLGLGDGDGDGLGLGEGEGSTAPPTNGPKGESKTTSI